ncbi:unnamed protein product [Lota lota]
MDYNKTQIRTFVRNQLNDAPDLGALTLGILKRQYMSHVGCESLSPEAKTCIKRVVEEELLNMQISGTDVSRSENASVVPSSNKRKRGEDDEANSGRSVDEDDSRRAGKGKHVELNGKSFETGCAGSKEDQDSAEEQMDISDKGPAGDTLEGKQKVGKRERKPRSRKRQTKASSDEEKESSSSLSDEISEDEDKDSKKKEAPGNKLDGKQKGATGGGETGSGKQQAKASAVEVKKESSSSQSDKDSEEDDNIPKKKEAPGNKLDGKQKVGKRRRKTGSGKQQAKALSYEEKQPSSPQSDEDGKEDQHPKENTPKQDGRNSEDADSDKEGELPMMKTKEDAQDPDSSSSSLTSLEDEKEGRGDSAPAKKLTKKKGDKKKRKEDNSETETEENKAVLRLKRYISLCGARRNYKKLFEGCRSIRSKVAVLKKELEDLGVKGLPSIEKCKKARLNREEAQELAELDVSNIITTQGRPKRRGPSAWQEPLSSPAARYKRTVNSDSDEGSPTDKGPNGRRHWGNLQGIISDDGDSD